MQTGVKKMKNNAQMIGQIFVFVLAALVFMLILWYGYSAITSFLKSSEQVGLADFKSSFVSGIEQIKPDFGSVRKLTLYVPKRYYELCVVSAYPNDDVVSSDFSLKYPVLFELWSTGSENVFLLPKQETPFLVQDIYVSGGYFCTKISGVADLRIEGLGDGVRVSLWQ